MNTYLARSNIHEQAHAEYEVLTEEKRFTEIPERVIITKTLPTAMNNAVIMG